MIAKMITILLVALFGHLALADVQADGVQAQCDMRSRVQNREHCLEVIDVIRNTTLITLTGGECTVMSRKSCTAVVCNQHMSSPISIEGKELAATTEFLVYELCIDRDHYGKWWDTDKKVDIHNTFQLSERRDLGSPVNNKRDLGNGTTICDLESPAPMPIDCGIAIHKVLKFDSECFGLAHNTCANVTHGDCFAKVCNLVQGPAICMDVQKITAQFQYHVMSPCVNKGHYGTYMDETIELGLVYENSSLATSMPDKLIDIGRQYTCGGEKAPGSSQSDVGRFCKLAMNSLVASSKNGQVEIAPKDCKVSRDWNPDDCAFSVCNLSDESVQVKLDDLAQVQQGLSDICLKEGRPGSWTDGKVEISVDTVGQLAKRQTADTNGTTCDLASSVESYSNCLGAMRGVLDNVVETDKPCFSLEQNTCTTATVGSCFAKVCNLVEGPAVCMDSQKINDWLETHILVPCLYEDHYGWWRDAQAEVAVVSKDSRMATDKPDLGGY